MEIVAFVPAICIVAVLALMFFRSALPRSGETKESVSEQGDEAASTNSGLEAHDPDQ
jgi:hypothetical protein